MIYWKIDDIEDNQWYLVEKLMVYNKNIDDKD